MGKELMASIGGLLLLLLPSSLPLVVGQKGFISVDCGKPTGYNYRDENTTILYNSDSSYIDTGESHNISVEVLSASLNVQTQDLRSFPDGKRNCYSLRPVTKGSTYIVRAIFLHGNYDGEGNKPQFDLYLDTNLWSSVRISDSSHTYVHELFAAATGDSVSVCLVNTGTGTPFISALEVRPIGPASYADQANATMALRMVKRVNFGAPADSYVRYPEDIYDRIWEPFTVEGWTQLSTISPVSVASAIYNIPSRAMQTAVTPESGSSLDFSWPVDGPKGPSLYYITECFAELVQLQPNITRVFNMSESGTEVISGFSPAYLDSTTYYNTDPSTYENLEFSVYKTRESTLPPIINAMEIYMVQYLTENSTFAGDVQAVMDIKAAYKIQKHWTGDPCAPADSAWEGLSCSYTDTPYRITALDLSDSGLTGSLTSSLVNLTRLKYLDLSMNNLTGGIPRFLAGLANLELLNLTCSGLNGPPPTELLNRSSLKLLLPSDSCQSVEKGKSSKNVLVIALSAVGAIVLLLLVLTLLLWVKRRKGHGPDPTNPGSANSGTDMNDLQWPQQYCRIFTTSELVKMTENYRKIIGKGGSGDVFYGLLENRKPVAVKKLTKLTPNSLTQFEAEINALKGIHHRNLVPFIGYCEDKDSLALVYEYMPNGSLEDHLAGRFAGAEILSWNKRLHLASEAAQGLEYLHMGCQRPIVHRDVKAANILLTADLEARVADFGLSKIFATHGDLHAITNIMGTPGYLDPEYSRTGTLTEKSDVYSFGVVLLELMTGLPRYLGGKERTHIVEHVNVFLSNGDLQGIVDKKLLGDYDVSSAWKAVDIAMACAAANSADRPTMSEVLVRLKDCCVAAEAAHRGAHSSHTSDFAGSNPMSFTASMTSPSAR